MNTGLLCAAVVMFLLALLPMLPLLPRARLYRRIHQPGFLLELHSALSRAKPAALASTARPSTFEELTASGMGFLLEPGLAVVYTVDPKEDGTFVHHLSMSYRGTHFARASATYLAAACCLLLRPPGEVALAVSPGGVYHLQFVLPASAHASWAPAPLEALDASSEPGLAAAALAGRGAFLQQLQQL